MKTKTQLEKEIEYWNEIEKKIDDCPKEDYEEFTRLEKLWMNCPIDKLKATLTQTNEIIEMIEESIWLLKKSIEKCKDKNNKDYDEIEIPIYEGKLNVLKELLTKIKGGNLE